MAPQPTDRFARELVSRLELLEVVAADAPVSSAELADGTGASVSTVNRVVASFAREGTLERTDEGIVLTAYGEALARETRRFTRSVETARTLRPLLDVLSASPFEVDLTWFVDATVTESTPSNPYRPLVRYSELFSAADRKRLVGDRFVVPEQGVEAAAAAIDDGTRCTCVWSERALDRLFEHVPELVEWSAGRQNLTALVAETVPFDFALFDDRLLVYGFDDETGVVSVVVDTDDPDAVEWGTAVFEACREDADALAIEP